MTPGDVTGKDVNFELELVEFGRGRALTRDGMVTLRPWPTPLVAPL